MPTKKRGSNLPVKALVIGAFAFAGTCIVIGATWNILSGSDYFKVKEITFNGGQAAALVHLQGKNILLLDLQRESAALLRGCPECSRVRIVKVLPGRLFVYFVRRNPVALVKGMARYYCLDEDGTMFDTTQKQEDYSLPVIIGLERKLGAVQPGRRYKAKELTLALQILAQGRSSRALKGSVIRTVSVGDPMNAAIFLSPAQTEVPEAATFPRPNGPIDKQQPGLEIKLGADNIKNKFVLLDDMIAGTKVDIASIKYLDMRFKDPVMKLINSDKPERK